MRAIPSFWLPSVFLVVIGVGVPVGDAGAQSREPACCGVVSVDSRAGVATARVNETGSVFEFRASGARPLPPLRVGQAVYANFSTNQVSLDGRTNCCTITKPPEAVAETPRAAPATPAPAARAPAPSTTPPAQAPAPAPAARAPAPAAPPAARAPTPATRAPAPTTTPTPGRTTTPNASPGPGGLPTTVTTAPVTANVYTLPTITYGEPVPAPPVSAALSANFLAALPRFENRTVTARVNGRSVSKQMIVLNGREGIENAPIRDDARRLLGMHVRKLNLDESTVYFFDPEVAAQWLETHEVPDWVEPQEEEEDDSECGKVSINGVLDCGGDAADAIEAEYERARENAEDWWNESADTLADLWDEAQNCFADHRLPGGSTPIRFDITPAMAVNLSQSGTRGAGSGSVSGSVGLGIPMEGDLEASVDFFYIPCLPFVVRPRSISVYGDFTVGEQLGIQAVASGAFNKTYTIPPSGGPRIPIQVIPIVIGGVPVAILDLSAYIEGEIEVAASGSVTGTFTLSNEHTSTFDFNCSGEGCRTGSRGRPTSSSPITTTQSVQVEGEVSAKPGIYTALMLTLNVNVMSARVGPQPYLLGTAAGCGAATATQTDGVQSSGAQNAALVADLDWGVDFRAEALVGGKFVGNRYRDEITGNQHIWFGDLIPGGSSALRAALAGPSQAATGQPAVYKLRMPSCYPYDETARYSVTWTGNATPTAVPTSACDWEGGQGTCRFNPQNELELRFAWPTAGDYALTAALIGRGEPHETIDPPLPATELSVAVAGASTTSGAAGSGTSGGSGGRPGAGAPARGAATCCDVVPNPTMRGRLGRVVIAYPEEVSDARFDVFRPGEQQSMRGGYGNQQLDVLPGTYEVTISGKRIAGVTVTSAHETRIKVGVLRVYASDATRVDLVDPASGEVLIGGYGDKVFGLPPGEVGVRIAGETETVTIAAGQVVEF